MMTDLLKVDALPLEVRTSLDEYKRSFIQMKTLS